MGEHTWKTLETAIKAQKISIAIKILRKGSRGPLVRTLQERLNATGYIIQPMTDYFGIKTDTAVRNLQRKNTLLSDGVAGPNTWHALGVTDSAKPNVKPINSLPSIVEGLGVIGIGASAAARAPKIRENAKPVSQLNMSAKGLQFLYTREALDRVSNRLHWPGGASGVTLGSGYDMKERSEASIIRDLIKIHIPADLAKKVAKGAGLKGVEAKKFCRTNNDLVMLTNREEFTLMETIISHYEVQARKKIKVNLMQHEFDALVSFAYNLGEVWSSMAKHINNGKIYDAMISMKAANKSQGKINTGLVKRRALEIALYTLGDYGRLRSI